MPAGHYGLVGIRELADLLGATLAIEGRSGRGTTVSVNVPVGGIAVPSMDAPTG